MTRRRFRWALALQLALLSLISLGAYRGLLPTVLPWLPHSDLPIHALLYGLLGAFFDGALGFRQINPGFSFPRLGAVLVIVAAGVEEYAQRFSARRTSTYSDFIADVTGVLFFSCCAPGAMVLVICPVPSAVIVATPFGHDATRIQRRGHVPGGAGHVPLQKGNRPARISRLSA